jgi:hypothetical protein
MIYTDNMRIQYDPSTNVLDIHLPIQDTVTFIRILKDIQQYADILNTYSQQQDNKGGVWLSFPDISTDIQMRLKITNKGFVGSLLFIKRQLIPWDFVLKYYASPEKGEINTAIFSTPTYLSWQDINGETQILKSDERGEYQISVETDIARYLFPLFIYIASLLTKQLVETFFKGGDLP